MSYIQKNTLHTMYANILHRIQPSWYKNTTYMICSSRYVSHIYSIYFTYFITLYTILYNLYIILYNWKMVSHPNINKKTHRYYNLFTMLCQVFYKKKTHFQQNFFHQFVYFRQYIPFISKQSQTPPKAKRLSEVHVFDNIILSFSAKRWLKINYQNPVSLIFPSSYSLRRMERSSIRSVSSLPISVSRTLILSAACSNMLTSEIISALLVMASWTPLNGSWAEIRIPSEL